MKDADAYRAEVLFLCGFSVRETSVILFGQKKAPGAINRLVTRRRLAELRDSEQRIRRLVDLDSPAPGRSPGFVDWAATKSALAAAAELGAVGQYKTGRLNTVELRHRLNLPSMINVARGVVSERVFQPERRKRGSIIENVANCSLQLANTRNLLPDWAYAAGLRLRSDALAASVGGGRTIDFTKEAVDGGKGAGVSDGALDALQRMNDIRAAVEHVFGYDDDPALRWFWLDQVAIAGRSIKQVLTSDATLAPISAKYLKGALEPVAHIYQLAPAGTKISERLEGWTPPSELSRQRAAMREAGFSF